MALLILRPNADFKLSATIFIGSNIFESKISTVFALGLHLRGVAESIGNYAESVNDGNQSIGKEDLAADAVCVAETTVWPRFKKTTV